MDHQSHAPNPKPGSEPSSSHGASSTEELSGFTVVSCGSGSEAESKVPSTAPSEGAESDWGAEVDPNSTPQTTGSEEHGGGGDIGRARASYAATDDTGKSQTTADEGSYIGSAAQGAKQMATRVFEGLRSRALAAGSGLSDLAMTTSNSDAAAMAKRAAKLIAPSVVAYGLGNLVGHSRCSNGTALNGSNVSDFLGYIGWMTPVVKADVAFGTTALLSEAREAWKSAKAKSWESTSQALSDSTDSSASLASQSDQDKQKAWQAFRDQVVSTVGMWAAFDLGNRAGQQQSYTPSFRDLCSLNGGILAAEAVQAAKALKMFHLAKQNTND